MTFFDHRGHLTFERSYTMKQESEIKKSLRKQIMQYGGIRNTLTYLLYKLGK